MVLSGELGHYWFGTSNSFYGDLPPPFYSIAGIQPWKAGLSFTYKVFTLYLRYVDTDLSKS